MSSVGGRPPLFRKASQSRSKGQSGETVAEQVAKLPPLNIVLGLDLPPIASTSAVSKRRANESNDFSMAVATHSVNAVSEAPPPMDDVLAWRQLEQSLHFPLLYRADEDVTQSIQLLQRIPFFSELTEDDLLAVAGVMKLEHTRGHGAVIHAVRRPTTAEEMEEEDEAMRLLEGSLHEPLDFMYHKELCSAKEPIAPPETSHAEASTNNCDSAPAEQSSDGGAVKSSSLTPEASGSRTKKGSILQTARPVHRLSQAGSMNDSILEDASLASTLGGASEDYPDQPLFVLLQGKLLLEIPTIDGRQEYPVLPGDTLGYELLDANLPPESRYIAVERSMLLKIDPGHNGRLWKVIRRAERQRVEAQADFLRHRLQFPVFQDWSDEEFDECASYLIPLRLQAKQLLVQEGRPSDALYFIVNGNLVVTRRVHDPSRKRDQFFFNDVKHTDARMRQELREECADLGWEASALCPDERVMQVATMNAGEFVGELGLLAHNPDLRPGEGTVWSNEYWMKALSSRYQLPPVSVEGHDGFLQILRQVKESPQRAGTEESKSEERAEGAVVEENPARHAAVPTTAHKGEDEAAAAAEGADRFQSVSFLKDLEHTVVEPQSQPSAVVAEEEGGTRTEESDEVCSRIAEELEDMRYPAISAPRMATVYAQRPSQLYMLAYPHAKKCISGMTLTRLREFVKGYPSHDDLHEQYEKQLQWAVYREQLLDDVHQKRQVKAHVSYTRMKF